MTHLDFFKKLKLLKSQEPTPGVLVCFFFSLSLIFCLFLLDYRIINGFNGQLLLTTWLKPNSSPKVGFIEVGFEGCDIFKGNWVWDESYPLYQPQDCVFLDEGFRCTENGRPDHFYTKWRWQPKDCSLPRFDPKFMLEKLQNQRLVFVGDSIGRNQWESLLCMLSSAIPNKTSIYEVNGNPITKHTGFLIFKFRDFNCTIEYYRAPFLVLQSRAPKWAPEDVKMTLKLDQMDWSSLQWKGADLLVFNTGHWWNYEKTIRGGGDWKNGGSCHLETVPDLNVLPSSSQTYVEYETVVNGLSEHLRMGKIDFLNVTAMTSQRKDGHASLYYLSPEVGPASVHRQDCSHWCLPGVPDSWNELLYAVFLRRGISQGRE